MVVGVYVAGFRAIGPKVQALLGFGSGALWVYTVYGVVQGGAP